MGKYQYGVISGTKNWYVRPKEWKASYDNKGDLQKFCRVLKIFRTPAECIRYINYLVEHGK